MAMKLLTASALALTALTALCQSALAKPVFPENLQNQPEKFCVVAGAISKVVMERRNRGEPLEYLYEEAADLDNPALRTYILETVTMSSWFPAMTPGDKFSEWNYNRCMQAMTARK